MACVYQPNTTLRPTASVLAVIVLLVGCGSGGGGSDANAADDMTEVSADDEAAGSGADDSSDSNAMDASDSIADDTGSDDETAGNEGGADDMGSMLGDGVSTDGSAPPSDAEQAQSPDGDRSDASDGDGGNTQIDADGADAAGADSGQPSDSDYEGGPCPSTAPSEATTCENNGVLCSYGLGDAGCRERFNCQMVDFDGTFLWGTSNMGGICQPALADCPVTPEGQCDAIGERCMQEGRECYCTDSDAVSCSGDGCDPSEPPVPDQPAIPPQWVCLPGVQEGCPPEIPNAGSRCGDGPSRCLYDGIYAVCVDGYYDWEFDVSP